jgi:hypothetical protein
MKTRHSQTLRVELPAPRNPFASAARARHAGSHRAPAGARRQQARRELQHLLQREDHTPPTRHRHSP